MTGSLSANMASAIVVFVFSNFMLYRPTYKSMCKLLMIENSLPKNISLLKGLPEFLFSKFDELNYSKITNMTVLEDFLSKVWSKICSI